MASGIAPEVVMKLYREFVAGNIAEARPIQFKGFLDVSSG
jgi:dihydrodipicolinate synthase/N-acetylneuraminate lyase